MATNYAKANYTEIIDLQTVKDKVSIVGIHTPTGTSPYLKLKGFFTNFRKFRYKGVSRVTMVPAANLPVDPLGLTGIVGTTDLMDPRDNLNPIIGHGCHGESMDMIINQFFAKRNTSGLAPNYAFNPTSGYLSDSADMIESEQGVSQSESRYYNRLTDPSWRKFGIQSGVHLRRLVPLTWKLVQTAPIVPGYNNTYVGAWTNPGGGSYAPGTLGPVPSGLITTEAPVGVTPTVPNPEVEGGLGRTNPQLFTNGVARLGWLPTVSFTTSTADAVPVITTLPKLFMYMLCLPPAYNVEQFFRLSITHVFEFKDFTVSLGPMDDVIHPSIGGDTGTHDHAVLKGYYNWIDYTEDGNSKVVASDPVDFGGTLDVVNGSSNLVSDGVL